ncbi:MAG: winged helix-turn-helix transcriptional regulator [Nitrososphaerota archaeon]|nr:winged helix-turn-helix transcriptional regulator [Candidatus Bathyarchaeota archaeon]MDW8048426.1 winged helix-turn-helix transcriptional regulator [Nitrososphaerota archaeon]
MRQTLDDLDHKIIRQITSGVHSYDELARSCNVGRNTIYRRIERLEKQGLITKRITAFPNFEKLGLSAVILGINVNTEDLDKMISFLKRQSQVKFLWKTYGTHDIIVAIICDKGDVGECIYNLRNALEKMGIRVQGLDVSTSISWEKIDLTPY